MYAESEHFSLTSLTPVGQSHYHLSLKLGSSFLTGSIDCPLQSMLHIIEVLKKKNDILSAQNLLMASSLSQSLPLSTKYFVICFPTTFLTLSYHSLAATLVSLLFARPIPTQNLQLFSLLGLLFPLKYLHGLLFHFIQNSKCSRVFFHDHLVQSSTFLSCFLYFHSDIFYLFVVSSKTLSLMRAEIFCSLLHLQLQNGTLLIRSA